MRKQNSEFLTAFTSEAGNDLRNTDYFGFVELDDYACYVIADGIDDQLEASGAKLAVLTAVAAFSEAPSMSRRTMRKCLNAANRALLGAKSKTKLKASVMIVITDYVKLRYGQAGNIRLRLYRNGFVKEKTKDQSLAMELVTEQDEPQDKVAAHEERNNLYAWLGQEKGFSPCISRKIKLTNADAIALYTGGIWEHVDEGELEDVFAEASDDPKETVCNIEDLLLSRQPEDLKKYTFVVIFANKIFSDPARKRKIRMMILIMVIILVVLLVTALVAAILYRGWQKKKAKLALWYTDTIEYIQMDNYAKAGERCGEALSLAESLGDRQMQAELANYQKLIEAVNAAQGQLDGGEYGALVLAAAGLKRLGLEGRISRYFTTKEMVPAAGQGILCIQGRAEEDYGFLQGFFDEKAKECAIAERAYIAYLNGGCSCPIGVYAEHLDEKWMRVRGLYYNDETGEYGKMCISGDRSQAEGLGVSLAQELKRNVDWIF